MKKLLFVILLSLIRFNSFSQNLYLIFDQSDTLVLGKYYGKQESFPVNRNGYREHQTLYSFYGTYSTPQVVGTINWWRFDIDFITIDKNNYQIIDMSEVSSYTPINIDQLAVILQSKPPKQNAEYFRSFQKIYIIEVGLPNNKAKVIEVKRCIGLDCHH